MTMLTTGWARERTTGTINKWPAAPVFAVVGFDGSPPALRALDGATRLLHHRAGGMEVVYVAHLPAIAALAELPGNAPAEVLNGFDDASRQLSDEVRAQLQNTEQRWHFQRRDGAIADELITVANDLRHQHAPPPAAVVIVVGRSGHRYHHVLGSVAQSLQRHNHFPVIVILARTTMARRSSPLPSMPCRVPQHVVLCPRAPGPHARFRSSDGCRPRDRQMTARPWGAW
jgi:nucleotide-binding universal stress UspA family protein